jgi:hypothetical protein
VLEWSHEWFKSCGFFNGFIGRIFVNGEFIGFSCGGMHRVLARFQVVLWVGVCWVYGSIQCGNSILQSLAKNGIDPKVIKCMKILHIRPKCHTNTYGSQFYMFYESNKPT